MSNISTFPGTACLYFEEGRCLFEERLNPGYEERWRCTEMARWEKEYDRFMEQAEAFNLDERMASIIWTKRFAKLAGGRKLCECFAPGGDNELLNCAFLHEDICLRELPACTGVCRLFVSRETNPHF